eukprot:GFUD01131698.1.p1 GENE.GFUD01131698.1~~GFUD01131698.1.p1  ORF type:complete len:390 (-),score=44.29 GFUD01131698.1:24-1172(-)
MDTCNNITMDTCNNITINTCNNLNFTEIIYASYKCMNVDNTSNVCEVHYDDAKDFCESTYTSCDWISSLNQSQLFVEPFKVLNFRFLTKKCILWVISLISSLGIGINFLTLTAIPYVRWRYKTEFSILQSPPVLLVLHLSFCNLLYCGFGVPHFFQSINLGYFPYGRNVCFWIALLRNLVAQSSIATQGFIAFCVYNKKMFENGGTKYVIVLIWISSFITIVGDIFGITGEYKWTGSAYGCDAVYEDSKNFGILASVFGSFLLMLCSYFLISINLAERKKLMTKSMGMENVNLSKHISTFVFITLVFGTSVTPAACLAWGLTDLRAGKNLTLVVNCLYWSSFAVGVLLYVLSNQRIKDAYVRFFSDVKTICKTFVQCQSKIM